MTHTPSIQAKRLTVDKDHKHVLNEVSFVVQPGTLTGLIGPSGSGKTTLMRTIVGVQRITGGLLTVLGQPAGSSLLRSKIGYVTQDASVYTDLTVEQNVRYFATLASADHKQTDRILEQVQLTGQRRQLVANLSGGQRARVSLAVALLGDPDLLVMDEPTVGLDPILREELWHLFSDLAAQGKTLLISSHVMDEAEKCQSLLLLRDGKLLWQDSREELLRSMQAHSVQDAFMKAIIKGGKK